MSFRLSPGALRRIYLSRRRALSVSVGYAGVVVISRSFVSLLPGSSIQLIIVAFQTAFGEEAGGFGWSLSSSLPSVFEHLLVLELMSSRTRLSLVCFVVVGSLASHCRGNISFFTNSCALTEDVPGDFVYSFLRSISSSTQFFCFETVGVENGCDELYGGNTSHRTRARKGSLRGDQTRAPLGRYVATELELKLGRYVATELEPKLGRYVATEHFRNVDTTLVHVFSSTVRCYLPKTVANAFHVSRHSKLSIKLYRKNRRKFVLYRKKP
ncbi:hypothetical protein F2Q69_00043347 [Brassica cretica]|uniref:Uncharacterized protein n=1 Tax=Brassica cretica TaxID=69181 RepID=A0A8S9NC78_BRACR|nr:hypothetical protein F2Q69_00043347 [Brassica cretica]